MAGNTVRILVLAGYAKSLVLFRGPLLAELTLEGHEVIACAPEDDNEIAAAMNSMGVRYHVVPLQRTGLNPVADTGTLLRLVKLFLKVKPDVVLSYTVKPVIYGSLAARLAGVPRIYSIITGLGYAFLDKNPKGLLINRLVTGLYRMALRGNAAVFFQNPDDLSLFVTSRMVAEAKTVLINGSGVDTGFYTPAPLGDRPVFLLIARLLRDKGIREYVAAAALLKARHPRAVFRLLGPMDSNPSAISKEELDNWRGEGIIEYLGATDDVRPYLRDAAIYVLPSYREGTPRTVLEAMAMGRPIVTTDTPGCRETVVDGDNGFLVTLKDAEALAAAMERFILDPGLIEKMGRRSREIAEEKYDVQKVNGTILRAMGLKH